MEIIGKPKSRRATRRQPGDPHVSRHPIAVDDRARAVQLGTRGGVSAIDLSLNLGITERQVVRIRAKLRAEGRL